MRRRLGVMCLGLLASILSPLVASATPPTLSYQPNFRAALMQRLFGESIDSRLAVAALYGDPISESMLREHTFRVAVVSLPQSAAVSTWSPAPDATQFSAMVEDDPFVSPLVDPETGVATDVSLPESMTESLEATYVPPDSTQDVDATPTALEPRITAPPGAAYMGGGLTFSSVLSPVQGFDTDATGPDALGPFASSQISAVTLPVAMRLGKLHVQTRFEGAQAEAPELALNDQSSGLGANFDVRAGHRNVNVDVNSSFEHLTRNDATAFASSNFDATSSVEAPSGDQAPVMVPEFADVSKHIIATGIAVPVARRLTFGLQYNQEHLQGGYGGAPGISNLDAQSNTYGANLTLALPHTSSAITLSAKQYRYQDNLVPANTFTSAQANLNFTVKF